MIDLNSFKYIHNETVLRILKDSVSFYVDYFAGLEEKGEVDKNYDSSQIRFVLKQLIERIKQVNEIR